jgi:hypothetical protein
LLNCERFTFCPSHLGNIRSANRRIHNSPANPFSTSRSVGRTVTGINAIVNHCRTLISLASEDQSLACCLTFTASYTCQQQVVSSSSAGIPTLHLPFCKTYTGLLILYPLMCPSLISSRAVHALEQRDGVPSSPSLPRH